VPTPQQVTGSEAPAETQRHPRNATPSTTTPSTQTPQTAPGKPQPEFRLGQSLTADEQRTHRASIDQHLAHANSALASIGNRPLNNQQKSIAAQVRGFIAQSQQLRATDLVGSLALAEKADVLASDLVAGLK